MAIKVNPVNHPVGFRGIFKIGSAATAVEFDAEVREYGNPPESLATRVKLNSRWLRLASLWMIEALAGDRFDIQIHFLDDEGQLVEVAIYSGVFATIDVVAGPAVIRKPDPADIRARVADMRDAGDLPSRGVWAFGLYALHLQTRTGAYIPPSILGG